MSKYPQKKNKDYSFPTILNINARSLPNKMDELTTVLDQQHVDIAIITETWLKEDIENSTINIHNYNLIRNDRSKPNKKQGGGVCIYIKTNIDHKVWKNISTEIETLWITVHPHKMPRKCPILILGAVYHPPNDNNTYMNQHISETLDRIQKKHPYCGIIIAGDFNTLPEKHKKKP